MKKQLMYCIVEIFPKRATFVVVSVRPRLDAICYVQVERFCNRCHASVELVRGDDSSEIPHPRKRPRKYGRPSYMQHLLISSVFTALLKCPSVSKRVQARDVFRKRFGRQTPGVRHLRQNAIDWMPHHHDADDTGRRYACCRILEAIFTEEDSGLLR